MACMLTSYLLVSSFFQNLISSAQVYVHVHNQLMTDSATIHWHGLTHRGSGITGGKGTPWSDGAPYITQCPIPPGNSFTYRYIYYLLLFLRL